MDGRDAAQRTKEIAALVASIPLTQRTDAEETERRLARCRSCPSLVRGTCQLCGCYVEYRAAFRLRNCPDLPSRWEGQPDETGGL